MILASPNCTLRSTLMSLQYWNNGVFTFLTSLEFTRESAIPILYSREWWQCKKGVVPAITSTLMLVRVYTASKWLAVLVSGLIPSSVYTIPPQSTSPSAPQLCTSPISHTHAGASGHTVSLLAVTVVLVLECSTGGEGDWVDTLCVLSAVAGSFLLCVWY